MKMINVSEAALDSIKRMGEADRARIAQLESALKIISTWAHCDFPRMETRDKEMSDIHKKAMTALRVNTYSQSAAKDEN